MPNDLHPIHFEKDNFVALNLLLHERNYSQIVVLVDTNTQQYCLPILAAALTEFELNIIQIEAGEEHKNILTCQSIWNQMMDLNIDRKAVLLNLGGGVIGDMGGFCAATFKRGLDFIQIPTTLLAQVDASVGGKLGIDFALVKNSIGLFCNPTAVFINATFFDTLPLEQLQSGYAEILKHALIANSSQWKELIQIQDLATVNWQEIVQISLPIKQHIVVKDPFEKGIRKSLNFGHTIGHAIESLSWETATPLLHGHAVAIGLIIEAFLSVELTGLPPKELEQITTYILSTYPKYDLNLLDRKAIQTLILKDKKNEQTKVNCTLLATIGSAKINIHISPSWIEKGLNYYQQL